jgi:hypothetical protein
MYIALCVRTADGMYALCQRTDNSQYIDANNKITVSQITHQASPVEVQAIG